MKSPILILFIIFNLLAVSMVSASNLYDEETTESQLVQSQNDTVLASCIDESSCDDFCHIFTHMMGFISLITPFSIPDTSLSFTMVNEPFYSLTLDLLSQPPQTLI